MFELIGRIVFVYFLIGIICLMSLNSAREHLFAFNIELCKKMNLVIPKKTIYFIVSVTFICIWPKILFSGKRNEK